MRRFINRLYFHITSAHFFQLTLQFFALPIMLLFLFNLFFFNVFLFTLFRLILLVLHHSDWQKFAFRVSKIILQIFILRYLCKSNLSHSCFLESDFQFQNCFTCPSIINAILHINDLLWNINHFKFLVLNNMWWPGRLLLHLVWSLSPVVKF